MFLSPGLTFCVAPRFHCAGDWADRLRLSGGLVRSAAVIHPRDEWRAPAEAELRILVAGERAPPSPHPVVQLFAIPAALRSRWWELAERDEGSGSSLPGYDGLIEDLVEFLRFKRLPVPARCSAATVVSR